MTPEAEAPGAFRPDPADRVGADACDDVVGADFREAMSALAATVCVVATGAGPGSGPDPGPGSGSGSGAGEGAERLGRTVTAAFPLSADPPAILVSIDADSALAAAIRARRGFSVSMLSRDQRAVADAFAGKVPPARRFEHGAWARWPSGRPRLAGATACLDCVLGDEMATGGHMLFVGRPCAMEAAPERPPLLWRRRRYHRAAPL